MLALLLATLAQTGGTPMLRQPDIHGDKVVFTCEGDLWVGAISTGEAYRLTSDPGLETQARFSPDGSKIGYSAEYDGARAVFSIPTEGGKPTRITNLNRRSEMVDWSPDGQSVLFRVQGPAYYFEPYTVNANGGFPTRFPLEFVSDASYNADGTQIAFTRFNRNYEPWFGYHGGKKNDIWVGDLGARQFKDAFTSAGTNEWPAWAGDHVCFINDDGGRFRVLEIKPGSKDAPRVLAGPYDVELRGLHSDGKRLIYDKGGVLETVDLATGVKQDLTFQLHSDLRHTMAYDVAAQGWVGSASISPNGRRVAIEARGHLISAPVGEGAIVPLSHRADARFLSPVYSPDGKRIAYISDESNEQQVYLATADGSSPTPITADSGRQLKDLEWSPDARFIAVTDSQTRLRLIDTATHAVTDIGRGDGWDAPKFGFSPDSQWLVYERVTKPYLMRALELRNLRTGQTTPIGDGTTHDFAPRFSTDARFIAFITRRHLDVTWDDLQYQVDTAHVDNVYLLATNPSVHSPLLPTDTSSSAGPEPMQEHAGIEPKGIANRWIATPLPPRDYTQVAANESRVFALGEGSLLAYDFSSKAVQTVANDVDAFQLTSDGKWLMLRRGNQIRVVEARANDVSRDAGLVDFANYQLHIDPKTEWKEIYWDAWRLIRDYYWEPTMHGVDWNKVGAKYAAFLPTLRSRDELNELIRWMLAELSVSHAYTAGGDPGPGAIGHPASAFLGIDVTPDPSGYYKIAKIYQGDGFSAETRSPLAEPGLNIHEGDLLISVGDVPAHVGSPFLDALVGRAGLIVPIEVGSPDHPRRLLIRPLADEHLMRYEAWAQANREYVSRISGGKVGYVHLPDLNEFGMEEFLKHYFAETASHQALVIDDRFGGGGSMSENVIRLLNDKLINYFAYRNSADRLYTRQLGAFAGPMVMVTNEFAGSNSEEILYQFHKLGLGPIVGRRTWGGLVGNAPGWPLIDGGKVFIPNYGAVVDGKLIVEGIGVSPDYDVASDPNAYVRGDDPQLDKAVELALAGIKSR